MTIFREWAGGWGGRRRKCCQDQIGKYLKTLCLLYLTIASNGNMKCVHGNSVELNEEIANTTANIRYPNRLTNQQISIQSQSIVATDSIDIPAESQSLSTTSGACSCKIAIVNKNSLSNGVHGFDCIACQSYGKYEDINGTSNIDTDKRRQKPLKFKRTDEQRGSFGVTKAEDIRKNELRTEEVVVVRNRRHYEPVIDDATTDSVRGTMSLVESTDDNGNVGGPTTSMSSNIHPNRTSAARSPHLLLASTITMAPAAVVLSAETVDYSATTEEFFIKHVDMADTYGNFTQSTTTCSPDDENCIISLHNSTCVGEEIYCNYTYEEYVDMLYDYIYPTVPEWILIFSHAVVFFMGLVSTSFYTNTS